MTSLLNQRTNTNNKNNQIQALRGFLCLMIIIYHYTCRYNEIYLGNMYNFGFLQFFSNVGLAGFLFLSGYYSLPKNDVSGFKYFWSKVKRLYPDYLICILIIYFFQLTGYLGTNRSVSFAQLVLNIPFLNILFKTGFVDGAHWYIVFSFGLYAIIAISTFIKLDTSIKIYLNALIVSIAGLICTFINIGALERILPYIVYYAFFSLGLLFKSKTQKKINIPTIISTILLLLYLVSAQNIVCSILSIMMIAILCLAIEEKIQLIGKVKPLVILGNLSYIIYLLHQNIGYIVINYVHFRLSSLYTIGVIAAFIVVIILAVIEQTIKQKVSMLVNNYFICHK